ncbi:DUF2254 domain-containing protein [Mycoplasmatota bacterium]|nr:DUF2254 domain-containing protein [Mycoplasmatota bacterium]
MKKIINFINSKYYLKFLFYIIIFSLLSIGLFYTDKAIQGSQYNLNLAFSQDFLEDFLIMMIAGIITMVTITFSTIMVVLTLYSGQFSPRTLKDFLQRKVPLNILGYFIGVSAYALITLVISENNNALMYSSMTLFSLILMVISIVLFAYYIHYVSKSVQVNVYIDKMVKEAVEVIEDRQSTIKDDPYIQLERNEEDADKEFNLEYKTAHTGYLIEINKKKLLTYLMENNLSIAVNIPLNEHIYEDDILFKYNTESESFDFDEEMIDECFVIRNESGSFSEYQEKTMKLVEIAVRALSPGTNDPFTAVTCIDQLGFVFMKLSDSYYSLHYHDDEGKERLTIKTLNYDDLLYDHFYQIYLYGKEDLTIISSMLKAFARISSESNYDMKSSLWKFAEYILKDKRIKDLDEFDFREIHVPLRDLSVRCNKYSEYKSLLE